MVIVFLKIFSDLVSIRYEMTLTSFVFVPFIISFLIASTIFTKRLEISRKEKSIICTVNDFE
tara:strand:+ start:840 stop:1025 length:186 start_codon:yes stop_codon:yes gene_type:complete